MKSLLNYMKVEIYNDSMIAKSVASYTLKTTISRKYFLRFHFKNVLNNKHISHFYLKNLERGGSVDNRSGVATMYGVLEGPASA